MLLPDTAEHTKDSTLLPHLTSNNSTTAPARPPCDNHKRKKEQPRLQAYNFTWSTASNPTPPTLSSRHLVSQLQEQQIQLCKLTPNTDKTAATALVMAGAQQTGLRKRTPPFPTKQMTILGEFCKFRGAVCFEAFANENQHYAESANRLPSCRFSHMFTS